jgi:hypothetical protein
VAANECGHAIQYNGALVLRHRLQLGRLIFKIMGLLVLGILFLIACQRWITVASEIKSNRHILWR